MSGDWILPEGEGTPATGQNGSSAGSRPRRVRGDAPRRAAGSVASASDPWVLPDAPTQTAPAASPGWQLDEPATPDVSTGPSGLLLGEAPSARAGEGGPVTIRLFRSTPTRVVVAVPEYVTWLLAYRAVAQGAHLSIVSDSPSRWQPLVQAVEASGGTADLLDGQTRPPSAGRPYRPSLVIDDSDHFDGMGSQLGAWQAVLVVQSVTTSAAVFALRTCDLALMAPWDQRVAEQSRRAYALTPAQVRSCNNLAENEVVIARPRRVMRVAIPPTATEYQVLFA